MSLWLFRVRLGCSQMLITLLPGLVRFDALALESEWLSFRLVMWSRIMVVVLTLPRLHMSVRIMVLVPTNISGSLIVVLLLSMAGLMGSAFTTRPLSMRDLTPIIVSLMTGLVRLHLPMVLVWLLMRPCGIARNSCLVMVCRSGLNTRALFHF